jgi:hypothetical protein
VLGLLSTIPGVYSVSIPTHAPPSRSLIDTIRLSIEPGALQFSRKFTGKAGLFPCATIGGDGPMSNNAGNITSLDRFTETGTYSEALLEQSHRKEAATRSAKFLNYRWSANEYVICSRTTHGILESLINPNTMEVIHHWASQRDRQRRLVKVR